MFNLSYYVITLHKLSVT